jgi:hypothetical protein
MRQKSLLILLFVVLTRVVFSSASVKTSLDIPENENINEELNIETSEKMLIANNEFEQMSQKTDIDGKVPKWPIIVQVISMVVLIITAGAIYYQSHIQKNGIVLQSLNNFREHWYNASMIKFRQETCKRYEEGNKKIGFCEGEVLGFFEELGLLVRKRLFSIDFIWETYSYFIEHYWDMLKDNINEYRKSTEDNSWYENFEDLKNKMESYSKKKHCPVSPKTEHDIKKFVKGEREELENRKQFLYA